MNLLKKLLKGQKLTGSSYYLNGVCFVYQNTNLNNGPFQLNSYKEVAAFGRFEVKDFIAYAPEVKDFNNAFKRIKLLDRQFGLKTKFNICIYEGLKFIVLHNTWYNKNRISRDLARTILKYNQSHPRDCKYAQSENLKNHRIWADPVKYIDSLPQKIIEKAEIADSFGLFNFLSAN